MKRINLQRVALAHVSIFFREQAGGQWVLSICQTRDAFSIAIRHVAKNTQQEKWRCGSLQRQKPQRAAKEITPVTICKCKIVKARPMAIRSHGTSLASTWLPCGLKCLEFRFPVERAAAKKFMTS